MRVIGFEPTDLPKLDAWTRILSDGVRNDEAGEEAGVALVSFLTKTLSERAEEAPREDLISLLVAGRVDGRPLSMEEQLSMLFILTFGGLHTTGSVTAGALVWLADHPADRVRLRTHPELMTTAVDEFVRYVSPVSHMRRTTTREVELSGYPIGAGQAVVFGMGSANHDEEAFDHPDDIVLDRYPNHHVGFGGGAHRCVGSHLGKLGVQIAIEEFLSAIPNFEIEDHHAFEWRGGEGRGLEHAPVVVTAP
jgi:cytochrome P450